MNELIRLLDGCFANQGTEPAICSSAENISYAQLNERRREIEAYYQRLGLVKNDRIGLLLPKSPTYVAAILAAIRLGLIYVPIDFDAPFARSAYILKNAECKALLTTVERVESYQKAPTTTIVKDLDLAFCQLKATGPKPTSTEAAQNHSAYVLYTSGSTGKPKGVRITAANAACFVNWAAEAFSITKNSVVASIAPFHFDLSVFDLFASLKSGATLVLFSPKETKNPLLLGYQIAELKIDTLYATPSLLQLILRYGKLDRYDFSQLRQVLFAGEVFPAGPLRDLTAKWEATRFYNLYGPTETNVVTWHAIPKHIPAEQQVPYPIGQLCPYAEALLKSGSEFISPAPGQAGELLISGTSVTPGYLGLSELQQSRFCVLEGKTWYATGDLVRINEKEELVYTGRADRMIKRRGYRIELAEIENNMVTHPDITIFGAVALQKDGQVAVIGLYEADTALPEAELKQYLVEFLPLYMIPDRFVHLEQIPLTSSQKVDYQRLQKIATAYV